MSDILREYLVAIGFKIDEPTYAKYQNVLAKSKQMAVDLSGAAIGAAVATGAAITEIAKQYNDLYYAQQRFGKATISDIKAIDYGGRQIGLTYEQTRGTIESFATSVRNNPGLKGLLTGMGIDPNDAVKGSQALIGRLKSQFGESGYFVASRMAQMYGIDEGTFRQMWTNYDELQKKQAEYNLRLRESGVDMQKLTKDSREYTNANDNLLTSLNLILTQTSAKWLPTMKEASDKLDEFARGAVRAGAETGGWSSTILSLVASLGALKIAAVALSFIPGFGRIGNVIGKTAGFGAKVALGGGVIGGSASILSGMQADANNGNGVRSFLRSSLGLSDPKETADIASSDTKMKAAIDYFVSQGWSREQATGIAANFFRESGLKRTASNMAGGGQGAHGIGQWRGKRLDDFRRVMGKDVKDATFEEQLAFAQWELQNTEKGAGDKLRGAKTARDAGVAFSTGYERHGNAAEDATRGDLAQQLFDRNLGTGAGGGTTVNIQQKTDIKMDGGGNSRESAERVLSGQERVNGDLVRNTKGAVR